MFEKLKTQIDIIQKTVDQDKHIDLDISPEDALKKITENRTNDEKQAETAAANAISRNEFLEASLIEFYNLDEELRKKSQDDKESADKAEQERLENEVARAKIRFEALELLS